MFFKAPLTREGPAQRDNFIEILDYVITKGFYVSLAANGVWDSELTREICRRKIDDVIVSLEGPEEIKDFLE